MKNDPKGLSKILNGKLIIPESGDCVYITADIDDPAEFIFIPHIPENIMKHRPVSSIETLLVPGGDDISEINDCLMLNNGVFGLSFFTKEDFTWVGSDSSGCWAYYPKNL